MWRVKETLMYSKGPTWEHNDLAQALRMVPHSISHVTVWTNDDKMHGVFFARLSPHVNIWTSAIVTHNV